MGDDLVNASLSNGSWQWESFEKETTTNFALNMRCEGLKM
jgi:hypothetical protein